MLGFAVDRKIQLDLASKYCKTNIWLMNLTTMALIVYLRVAVFNSNKTFKQIKYTNNSYNQNNFNNEMYSFYGSCV